MRENVRDILYDRRGDLATHEVVWQVRAEHRPRRDRVDELEREELSASDEARKVATSKIERKKREEDREEEVERQGRGGVHPVKKIERQQ